MGKTTKVSINIDDFVRLREELSTRPEIVLAKAIQDRLEESMEVFDNELDNSLSLLENTDISIGYDFMKREHHYQYSKRISHVSGKSLVRLNYAMRSVKTLNKIAKIL